MSAFPPAFEDGPGARLAAYFEQMSAPRPIQASAKAEWVARRQVVRQEVRRILGIDPAPQAPLNIRRGGSLQREGYRVERLYWQTWPGVYASGWLYLPDPVEAPAPAILNPHGHLENGARHPTVQTRLIALARLGYVALAVDSVHPVDYAVGVNPVGVMTWNNLRALDVLCGMPEVDPQRLGVTGVSGGAQQAMYLMALDDRVKAAVPAALVTYFRRILMPDGEHCHCNHVPGLLRVTDAPEICAVFAPRPALYLTLTGDWTAPFGEEELGELRGVYRLWGRSERLDHELFEGPHDYTQPMRERAYAWFNRWLRGIDDPEAAREPAVTPEPPEALLELDDPPQDHHGWQGVGAFYRERAAPSPPRLESRATRKRYQERTRGSLADLLGGPATPVAPAVQRHAEGTAEGFSWEVISYQSEAQVRIPAVLLRPPTDESTPVSILLHPEGKSGWGGPDNLHSLAQALLEAGHALLLPDPRLHGEMHQSWRLNSVVWGRPEAGMATQDVLAAVNWIHGREEFDAKRILVLGRGDMGVTALSVAALEPRVTACVADCCGTTYRDGGEGLPVIPNLLREMDVPQLGSLIAPRKLLLYHVPGHRMGFSSRRYFDWTKRTYQSFRADRALRMTANGLEAEELLDWLG